MSHSNTTRDSLHLQRRQYDALHPLGFPDLLPQTFTVHDLPDTLLSYRSERKTWTPGHEDARMSKAICHFFLDDYRFESVWTQLHNGMRRVERYWGALTPDFSLYANWPTVCQQWNHYRQQWLGCYWQEHGIPVIPTVNWSTPDSFYWCFSGIPQQQIVALSVPDLRSTPTKRLFMAGYRQMLKVLQPSAVLVYGTLPEILKSAYPRAEIREYPPDWLRLRDLNRSDE